MSSPPPDIAIVGGGLSGGLIALAMAKHRPDLSITLIEKEEFLGGNHVWSFFASDLDDIATALVEPLIAARWDGYDVCFPAHCRHLATPYRSTTSQRLNSALRRTINHDALLTGRVVAAVSPGEVRFADGTALAAGAVIDARGIGAMPHMRGGWQKFVGQMVRLENPHGLTVPIVMDARVEQIDGYRFVYVLPFSEREVFIEDTYYADGPHLDRPALAARIARYATAQGWTVTEILHEEVGVLPVIAEGDLGAFLAATAGNEGLPVARAGTRAALIHPLTSYSLPDAARFALYLTGLDNLSGPCLVRACQEWSTNHWYKGRYYRMLTQMLFGAAAPLERRRIFERFYTLAPGLIERFYAARSTPADKLRILAGRPPVPLMAAIRGLVGQGRPLADLGLGSAPGRDTVGTHDDQ